MSSSCWSIFVFILYFFFFWEGDKREKVSEVSNVRSSNQIFKTFIFHPSCRIPSSKSHSFAISSVKFRKRGIKNPNLEKIVPENLCMPEWRPLPGENLRAAPVSIIFIFPECDGKSRKISSAREKRGTFFESRFAPIPLCRCCRPFRSLGKQNEACRMRSNIFPFSD